MKMKIGFIGLGNMGQAIIEGLSANYSKDEIAGYDLDPKKAKKLSSILSPCTTEQQVVDFADIIILAVKPNIVTNVLEGCSVSPKKVIVSIAAGLSLQKIECALSIDHKVIRVMPNTPALVNEGMSVLCPNSQVKKSEIDAVVEIFKLIGKTQIQPEKLMDAVTAISGCGPAYVFTIIQALADGGVKKGLNRKEAVELAAQTLIGASKMVLETGEEPIGLRNKVTSPGGSTIAAIHVLESEGFSGTIIDAVEEACEVSSTLG